MVKKNKTLEFDKSVSQYFKDIADFKPLSYEEEYSLWKKYRFNNDMSARNKLVTANLKFVASIAKNYIGRGLSFSDLIAEGNVGLIKSMDRFDASKNYKSISYSVWWVRQSILEALNKRNTMEAEDLPTDTDQEDRQIDDDYCSLETGDRFQENFIDDVSDEKERDFEEKKVLTFLLSKLNDREKVIISKYFGVFGYKQETLEEIGSEFNITKERTRQLLGRIFKKLRHEALVNNIDESIYYAETYA